VGLWGYFLVCKTSVEKYLVASLFFLCFAALVASKSRASLMIAIIALAILGLAYCYRTYKKYFFIALIGFLLLVILIVLGVKIANVESIPSLGWVGDLLIQMQQRRLDSLSDLGGMMGSRFEIWSAANNMFTAYPLMGVGEGEFYRLSSNISFARSEFLQLNHGENAHNYFLQVLAENGLIGISIFAIAFLVPYRACEDKRLILPAVIGLFSLFLGNVFAHAFLVRENLLLSAALLGLIYAFASDKNGTPGIFSKRITTETEQTVIGSENYIPVCRKCFSI
jgi:O-antigen ligase